MVAFYFLKALRPSYRSPVWVLRRFALSIIAVYLHFSYLTTFERLFQNTAIFESVNAHNPLRVREHRKMFFFFVMCS